MPPEVDQQKSPDRKPDLTRSQNPDDIIREMAVRDLKINYQQEKAQITSNAAAERAKTLGDIAPKIDTTPKSEQKPGDTAKATPEKQPAPATAAPAPTAEASNSPQKPEEKKKFMDQVKEFFSKMWAPIGSFFTSVGDKFKDWFGKIFKKKDADTSTPPASASNAPSGAPSVAPAASPASAAPGTPGGSGEKITYSPKENWQTVVSREAKRLGIDEAFAKAIISVEAGKSGINPDGTLKIRFEPHVFNRELAKKGNNSKPGGWGESTRTGRNLNGLSCEGGQGNEHACLRKAMEIDREAALNSISMGLGQIMGFNSKLVGYSNSEEMFNKFSAGQGGEPEQIVAMFKLIENTPKILAAARAKDFHAFTASYNGAKEGPAHDKYVQAMRSSYQQNGGSAVA